MNSINPDRPLAFRLRWRGYDRAEVDEFLRQTAAERLRLQEDLAQLEIMMTSCGQRDQLEASLREHAQMVTLRRDVASCLEASIAALRTATGLLGAEHAAPAAAPQPSPKLAVRPGASAQGAPRARPPERSGDRGGPASDGVGGAAGAKPPGSDLPASLFRRDRRLLLASAAAGLLLLATLGYFAAARGLAVPPARGHDAVAPIALQRAVPSARSVEHAAGQAGTLVLTLTAHKACWIRTSIDDTQVLERLLKKDETIMLHAQDHVVMRTGDAGALSLLINNQMARPLGASGQVVDARITRENYPDFLVKDSAPYPPAP